MQCIAGDASGTVNGYVNRKCRCKQCREAWRKYYVPWQRAKRASKKAA